MVARCSLALLLSLVACGGGGEPAACIEAVYAEDARLGALRNHAPEDTTLAVAIDGYVAGLDALDFGGCPDGFAAAYRHHRDAWADSRPFFARYDSLRGEMHDLFEQIRGMGPAHAHELASQEEAIWGTWAEVEAAAAPHLEPAGG